MSALRQPYDRGPMVLVNAARARAMDDLESALRKVKRLESWDVSAIPSYARGAHQRRLHAAHVDVQSARAALECLLVAR